MAAEVRAMASRQTRHSSVLCAGALLMGAIAVGCGASHRAAPASSVAGGEAIGHGCTRAVVDTLGGVAQRVYAQSRSGRSVRQAIARVKGSAPLVRAVSRGDPKATLGVLQQLRQAQITDVTVSRGTRPLARMGTKPGIAPGGGELRDRTGRRVGSFILAVGTQGGFATLVKRITGADVLVFSRGRQVAGTLAPGPRQVPDRGAVALERGSDQVYSFSGGAYPSGELRFAVLIPAAQIRCQASDTQTVAATLGRVARRIYGEERVSTYVRRALRHVTSSSAFRRAVASADRRATKRAIVQFFYSHIHIVRVRATRDGRLVRDVGGRYVLAPASATLHDAGGRRIGRVVLAVQDDAGYITLTRLFTGADVVLRTSAGLVPGSTLNPGPSMLPDRGPVSYAGHDYQAVTFTGRAFPSGALRISVLVRDGR